MFHYPPFNMDFSPNEFVELMKEYEVDICLYGHLHAEGHKYVVEGTIDAIEFHCISSDFIDFVPKKNIIGSEEMKVIIKKDYEEMSKAAGEIFIEAIKNKPNIILGLATGSTPIGMYKELIRAYKEETLDFSKVKTFNLDEYVGLDRDDPRSYRYFMNDELFKYININKENTYVPNGKAENLEEYCKKYDEIIAEAGGIDIQVLGIGQNGHIAFNEPDEELSLGTSVVKLTENTIEVNSRFFDSIEEVPKTTITMGIGSILKAKKIILLASGKNKATVVKKLLSSNKVTTMLPASFLLMHPDVTVIVDEAAYNG